MKKPTICCCITTYNSALYIRSTIKSVLNQTTPFDEILVVDDCSSDKTFPIVKYELKNIKIARLLKTQKRFGGPACGRNLAIKSNNCEVICFLDADDTAFSTRCEQLKKMFSSRQEKIIITPFIPWSERQDWANNKKLQINWFENRNLTLCEAFNFFIGVPGSCLSLRAETAKKLRFSEDKNLIAGEDREIIIRAAKMKIPIYASKDPLVFYNDKPNTSGLKHISNLNRSNKIYLFLDKKYKKEILKTKNLTIYSVWLKGLLKQKKLKSIQKILSALSIQEKIMVFYLTVYQFILKTFRTKNYFH